MFSHHRQSGGLPLLEHGLAHTLRYFVLRLLRMSPSSVPRDIPHVRRGYLGLALFRVRPPEPRRTCIVLLPIYELLGDSRSRFIRTYVMKRLQRCSPAGTCRREPRYTLPVLLLPLLSLRVPCNQP